VAQNAKSKYAYVGPGPYIVVYIDGTASAKAGVFKVQVAGIATDKPGLNETDGTTDGGLTWYDYNGATALAVGAGATLAFDLSPFGPSLIRLVRTDANGTDVFSALVTATGPN
jgi:hypothetical protein